MRPPNTNVSHLRGALIGAALVHAGCSPLSFESPQGELAVANGPAASTTEPTVLITVESSIADLVRADLSPGTIALEPVAHQGDIEIIEIPESSVVELANQIHEKTHRCGGFMAHDSMDDAVTAAVAHSQEVARNYGFAADSTIDRGASRPSSPEKRAS